ncbi:MAG: SEC-C metal-binding domain-containing protein [candidate division WOR-3 bacterium]
MSKNPGRNDPCPCGSGKKYKKCCMIKSSVGYGPDEFLKSKIIQDLREFSETHYQDAIDEAYDIFWDVFDPFELDDDSMLNFCEINFKEWFVYDYVLDENTGATIIDNFLKQNKNLVQDEINVLKIMKNAYISLYEVQEVFPEQGMLLKDVFSNEEYMVRERLATRSVQKWDIFATRLLYLDEKYIMSGCVYPYPLHLKENIIAYINHCYQDYKKDFPTSTFKEFLKNCSNIFNYLWCYIIKNLPKPILVTTDKEPFVFSKAIYTLTNKKSVIDKLTKAQELEKVEDNEFLWLNEKDTILAKIEVKDNELILECNSKERFERAKKIINKYLANLITHQSDEYKDPYEMLKSMKDLPLEQPVRTMPKEVEQKLYSTFMQQHYEKWLTESIPALDGKTPLEAVKTEEGKAKVIELLKRIEHDQEANKREGRPYIEIRWLWERLNIPHDD